MKRRSPFRRVLLGFLLLAFVAFAVTAAFEWTRFKVTVENQGVEPISQVELKVTGDSMVLNELLSGEKREIELKPEGESRVELNYQLGESRCRWKGGQVTRRGGHRVWLEIRGCGDVRSHVSRWPQRAPNE